MQRAKEAASDVAASAKSGMEKTKAMGEGKAEKWTTRDPARKEMAEEKKGERIREAEREKQQVYDENAAARQSHGGYGYTTGTGGRDYPAGGPARDDYPTPGTTEGVVGSQYPAGVHTGSERTGVLDPDPRRGRKDDDKDRSGVTGTGLGYGTDATF